MLALLYSLYANFCHKPDRPDAPDLQNANPFQLFPDAESYINYMSRDGIWGTQLEINVLAELFQLLILIWKLETRRPMDIINYNPQTNRSANMIHIVHCNNNHYEALIYPGHRKNKETKTQEHAEQQ